MALLLGYIFVLLFVLICAYVARVHYVTNKMCEKIPTLPGGHTIIGHSMSVNNELYKFIVYSGEKTAALAGITKTWIALKPVFIVTDFELVKRVLVTCVNKPYIFGFAEAFVGEGLFTASVPKWKRSRKLLNPAFNQQVIDGFIGVFNEQAHRLTDLFAAHEGKGQFDHRHLIARNLLETTCKTMMGLPKGEKTIVDDHYLFSIDRLLDILNLRISKVWLHWDFVYNMTSLKKEENELVHFVKQKTDEVIAARKAFKAEEKMGFDSETTKRFKSFLELILTEMEGQFTEEEIRNEVNTMVVAAYDTATTSMIMYFIAIGSNPKVQEKIYQELQDVFGDSDRAADKEDLKKLVYLEATLKESLRVYPVSPIILRELDEPLTFEKGTLPRGSVIAVNSYSVNRSKEIFGPDANEFKPERWLDKSNPPDPTALMTFSFGRRNCIGRSFAMLMTKIIATHVLRRLKVTGDISNVTLHYATMVKCIGGYHISVKQREKDSQLGRVTGAKPNGIAG